MDIPIKEIGAGLSVLIPIIITQIKLYNSRKKNDKTNNENVISKINDINEIQTKRLDELSIKFDKHIEEEANNDRQTKAMLSNIENDTRELNELHKHNRKLPQILENLDKEFKNIIEVHKLENEELKQMLFQTKLSLKEFASLTLNQDFKGVCIGETIQILEAKAKLLKSTVNPIKLELKEVKQFLTDIKLKTILPLVSIFAIELDKITKEKTNGLRRQAFEDLLINHLQKMLYEIIKIYHEYKLK